MWQDSVLLSLARTENIDVLNEKYNFEGSVYDAVKKEFSSVESFANADTGGNGGLMRLAPIPIFFYKDTNSAIQYATVSCATTHRAGFAIDACKLHAALICEALKLNSSKSALLDNDFYKKFFGLKDLNEEILEIAKGSYKTPADAPPEGTIGNANGKASKSLKAALWAFHDGNSFQRGWSLRLD
ncbi:ADP-ribosylarginine hydrolase Tri1-like isoform X2 [Paramacrobiotus metropolitanus]|uniref:ADP-ribosylarginine hydrolase Tri1-like isoform X2 n=1 Tax=Paramacrobiotus metropolitanus TaxID=2943436 RepID=UPI002446419C|nr:ADP-ribosylarginine hydrolase Tri1-like isoform X2 [Paramacrobiotus metropolitanus]